MNVCYLDMWPNFDVKCNWFNLVFQNLFPNITFNFNNFPKDADIIFASSFGNSRYQINNSKAIKIFYTGENERPDFNFADYSLTFDYDSYEGKNFRLPHWYLYINWWNEPNFPHARISLEQLNHSWKIEEVYNRPHFCSIIIGNPVRNRLEIAEKLNEYKVVHGFGRVFGKYYDGCKVKLLEKYRWNICFENSLYSGYITEKLLEAKVAGCIPIYYGDRSVGNDFNVRSFINYLDYDSPEHLLNHIKEIEKSPEIFKDFVEQPLFNDTVTLNELYVFLRKILNEKL